ncbi:hypothetical protein ScPMuIL_010987 [Solemya velum]
MEEGGIQKHLEGGVKDYGIACTQDSGLLLERNHVYSVYDLIAPQFNEIRHRAWPNVKKFLKNLDTASLVADIGCGNGRYLKINNNVFTIGLDRCTGLVDSAGIQGDSVIKGDNLAIPFRDCTFDAVISIGVIHHFATIERRVQAVKELSRILRPGGKMLLYVWAFEQKHRRFDSQDVLIPWHKSHNENRKQASYRGSSSSDKDLSSTSSVSEDDSIQEQPSPNLSSTRLKSKQYSTSSDSSVFEENVDSSCPLSQKDDPMRFPNSSSNLPSNGMQLHNDNCLILECRKFEASLRSLLTDIVPSKSYQPNSKKFHSAESLLFSSKNENFDSTKSDRVSSASVTIGQKMESETLTSGDIVTGSPRVTGVMRNKSKNSEKLLNFKSKVCAKSGVNDECNSPHLMNNSVRERRNYDSSQGVEPCGTESITTNHISEVAASTHQSICQKQTDKQEHSLFQTLKDDFLAFFMGGTEGTSSVKKGIKFVGNHNHFNELIPPAMSTDFETFAVREFPLSSCPKYRDTQFSTSQNSDMKEAEFPQLNNEDYDIHSAADNLLFHQTSGVEIRNNVEEMIEDKVNNPPNIYHQTSSVLNISSKPISTGLTYSSNDGAYDLSIDGTHSLGDDHCVKSDRKDEYLAHAGDNHISSLTNSSLQCANGSHSKLLYESWKTHSIDNVNKINENKSHELHRQMAMETTNQVSEKYQNGKVTVIPVCGKLYENGTRKHTIGKKNIRSESKDQNILPDIKTNKHSSSSNGQSVEVQLNSVPTSEAVNGRIENNMLDTKKSCVQELSRYYHVFREGELVDLILLQVPCLKVVSCSYDHANWCIVTEKL